MTAQIERHWRLLKILPDHTCPKATEQIWRELQSFETVSKRTVERDLTLLASIFPIGQRNEGRTNYWYWELGAKIWIPGLTIDEALALHMVEEHLILLLPANTVRHLEPYFQAAKNKLKSMPKGRIPWINKFRLIEARQTLLPASIETEPSRVVQEALLREQSVAITYRDREGRTENRLVLSPLAIVQRGVELYLIYATKSAKTPQFMPLQRVTKARLAMDPYDYPQDFDIDRYLDQGSLGFGRTYPIPVGKLLKLNAFFEKKAGERLLETPVKADQELVREKDGYRLKAQVEFSAQLVWWLLSYGNNVEITGPPELRNYIVSEIKALYERYAIKT